MNAKTLFAGAALIAVLLVGILLVSREATEPTVAESPAVLRSEKPEAAVLQQSSPGIQTEELLYNVGPVHLRGYLAYPTGARSLPGVLVVHEWWGQNDYARKRAEMLAELGYAAFALDMYGDGKLAEHPKDANAFMMEVINDADAARARFRQAMLMLRNHPASDPSQVAAIGYCFGGAVVMSMARLGEDLKGVVSFHGGLQGLAPIDEEEISTKFLVLNGADDPFVAEEHKQAFKAEMDAAGLDYEFIDYPGVLHSFTNPEADEKGEAFGLPLRYDAAADADSWERMQVFLTDVFGLAE